MPVAKPAGRKPPKTPKVQPRQSAGNATGENRAPPKADKPPVNPKSPT